jgi:hypothetical protein
MAGRGVIHPRPPALPDSESLTDGERLGSMATGGGVRVVGGGWLACCRLGLGMALWFRGPVFGLRGLGHWSRFGPWVSGR